MRSTLLLLLFFTNLLCLAQENIMVITTEKSMSRGKQPGFSVIIPQAKLKDVTSDWKKYVKQKGKSDYKERDDEYILYKTVIPEINSDSVILYTTFSALADTAVELTSFICSKDSVFFGSAGGDEETAKNYNTFVRNFAVNEYRNAVQEELKNEQRKLELLEDDLANLEKDNERSENKIHSNERTNDRIKDEIKGNLKLQEIKSSAISEQQAVVATYIEKSDLKKAEEKKLKEMEKEKKKLQNQNENLHKDIDTNESENKTLQKKIDKNNSEVIPAKKKEIEMQKEHITVVDAKLHGIK